MKRIMVVLMVLSMATVANAVLRITVDGAIDLPDTSICLLPSETAMIGVWGDGLTPTPQDSYIIIEGPAVVSGGAITYGGLGSSLDLYTDDDTYIPWMVSEGFNTNQAYYYVLIDMVTTTQLPLAGQMIDGILLHGEGMGDVVITMGMVYDEGWTIFDTQVIHQIPEPMTMAVLGLGGLFLRRRK
jgi:hypothetical protein